MIPADLIARAAAVDIAIAAANLGAVLRKASAVERVGACPRCGGHDRFAVSVRKKTWNCRGCGAGDRGAISLVMHVQNCSFPEAVAFLTGGASIPEPQSYARPKEVGEAKISSSEGAVIARLVAGIVRELVPLTGTPGEAYLGEIRRIDTTAIADVLERVDAVGWHGSVLFRESGHALDGRRLGCIVGVMTDPVRAAPTGAISRTYLGPDGTKIGKAKTLSAPAGIVRLSEDADVLGGLHLAEGLETALDAMARGFRPMWSTGSTAIMAKFPPLPDVEALTVFADHDQNGAGERAASKACERWRAAGREVRVYQSEIEGDLNDAFQRADR